MIALSSSSTANHRCWFRGILTFAFAAASSVAVPAQQAHKYDLLLQHGHVLDPKNHRDAILDVAIAEGKVAAVEPHLDPHDALKTVDVSGLYVTPGLVDIHVHAYAGTGEQDSYAGDNSVYPDGFTLRNGVTTVADAGSSGRKSFEDFKQRVIDRSQTRVLAFINIVGAGMRGPKYENNLDDMDGQATGEFAQKYPGLIVGIKTAHFAGPEWKPVDQAVIAGTVAHIPVMVDFGENRPERPLYDLLTTHLRPHDIYTHMYSGLRGEQDPKTLGPSQGMLNGRKRGIYFDVGHGGGSFRWSVAVPLMQAGFKPDSLSTDLHITSMNAGMKDMLNVADKMLALGETIPEVVEQMTSAPAHEIQHDELGNLSVGSGADVAVLRLEHGTYGFYDMVNAKKMGTEKLTCELTLRNGKVVYDLNGISSDLWDKPATSDYSQAKRWTTQQTKPSGSAAQPASPTPLTESH